MHIVYITYIHFRHTVESGYFQIEGNKLNVVHYRDFQ